MCIKFLSIYRSQQYSSGCNKAYIAIPFEIHDARLAVDRIRSIAPGLLPDDTEDNPLTLDNIYECKWGRISIAEGKWILDTYVRDGDNPKPPSHDYFSPSFETVLFDSGEFPVNQWFTISREATDRYITPFLKTISISDFKKYLRQRISEGTLFTHKTQIMPLLNQEIELQITGDYVSGYDLKLERYDAPTKLSLTDFSALNVFFSDYVQKVKNENQNTMATDEFMLTFLRDVMTEKNQYADVVYPI